MPALRALHGELPLEGAATRTRDGDGNHRPVSERAVCFSHTQAPSSSSTVDHSSSRAPTSSMHAHANRSALHPRNVLRLRSDAMRGSHTMVEENSGNLRNSRRVAFPEKGENQGSLNAHTEANYRPTPILRLKINQSHEVCESEEGGGGSGGGEMLRPLAVENGGGARLKPLVVEKPGKAGVLAEETKEKSLSLGRNGGGVEDEGCAERRNGEDAVEVAEDGGIPVKHGERFLLRKPLSTSCTIEHDTYVETFDRNDNGVSWGTKKSKDGSWEENWLQQCRVKNEDEVTKASSTEGDESKAPQEEVSKFGQVSGLNKYLRQRWTEKWETKVDEVITSKNIVEYAEDEENAVQEWTEVTKTKLADKIKVIEKEGLDNRARRPRIWRENLIVKEDETSHSTIIEKDFSEMNDLFLAGRIETLDDSGLKKLVTWREEHDEEGGILETWKDTTFELPSGKTWGESSGKNKAQEQWHRKWHRSFEGDREEDEWTFSADRTRCWGSKTGFSSVNQEEYNERWCKEAVSGEENPASSSYCSMDKWWSRPSEGTKWGEKLIERQNPLSESTELEAEGLSGGSEFLKLVTVEKEKWNETADEKSIENCIDSSTKAYNTHTGETKTLKLIKQGYQSVSRPLEKNEWWKKWGKIYTQEKEEEEKEQADELDLVGLKCRIRHNENYWKNSESNSWGDKSYEDLEDRAEKIEKWYNNGTEWQVDKWEVLPDGSRRGEKTGSNDASSVTWKEQWARNDAENTEWIDKSWEKHAGSEFSAWGEKVGESAHNKWAYKWGKHEVTGEYGDEWIEDWRDDKLGNFRTETSGKSWQQRQDEMHVTDYYSNKYGECLGQNEKWAYKQGKNSVGDEWTEKWNEWPGWAEAEKIGKNSMGEEWSEKWQSSIGEMAGKYNFAEKQGKNNQGESWYETWTEVESKKTALKRGVNGVGDSWEEEWGEEEKPDGSGEKWSKKWAVDPSGKRKGKSWGDKWGNAGLGGHKWGEEWEGENINKWWYDTDGRPPGC